MNSRHQEGTKQNTLTLSRLSRWLLFLRRRNFATAITLKTSRAELSYSIEQSELIENNKETEVANYPSNAITWSNSYGETIATWLEHGRMKVWHSDLEGSFFADRKAMQFAACLGEVNGTSSLAMGMMVSGGKCILAANEILALVDVARQLGVLQ